jgi:DNA mismatch repair protein MutS2
VTTHLEELKALAHMDPRFLNARVGFDPKRMAPTYKLQLGAAGASSAIEVASRMGLADHICQRARDLAMNAGGALAKALAAAEEDRRKLQDELERAKVEAAEAERLRRELEEQKQQFERERKARLMRFNEEVSAASAQAASEVQELLKVLRAQANEKASAEARTQLLQRAEEASQRARAAKAELFQVEAPPPPELRVGAWVRHSGLDKDVEILELTGDQALVAAGIMKMRVPVSELSGARAAKPKVTKFPDRDKQTQQLQRAKAAAPEAVEATNYRCDVRGMRAEDALAEVESFLDRGMRNGEEAALIVHGHGTGALRQAIRDYLAASPYIRMFRPGENHEGGDGVTVVALRA